jgi:exopolysaccharide biosynthesis polyprenyl glycosylphosphotransferase
MGTTRHWIPFAGLLKLSDSLLFALSFGLTTAFIVHAQSKVPLHEFFSMRAKISNFAIFALMLLLCHAIFSACDLYKSKRLSNKSAEAQDLLKATTFSTLCVFVVGTMFSVRMITVPFLATFWALSGTVLCGFRFLVRVVIERVRAHGRNLRYMLIVGTNARAVAFARRIEARPECGYRVRGFVDDEWPGMKEFNKSEFQLVSDYAGIAEYLRHNVVDEVVVYLPLVSFYKRWREIASLCTYHGIIIRFSPAILDLKALRWCAEDFDDGVQYIATYIEAREGWPIVLKRAMDIVVSSTLLLLLAPVLLITAIIIKLTSPGPVLFRQERIGLNKRRFWIYKFRTMVPNAETLLITLETQNEASGPVFKIRNDPRVTPVGRVLRRTSIDEFPQLLNVLKGDMSLVGPRPLPIRDYFGFKEDWQRRRFSVKPGITCLWQVSGRSQTSFERWMLLDLQYLDEWSLWLDLKILLQTVPAVIHGTGAT